MLRPKILNTLIYKRMTVYNVPVAKFNKCHIIAKYRTLGNFQGKIILLFLRICLQPRKFNYAKMCCSITINDN